MQHGAVNEVRLLHAKLHVSLHRPRPATKATPPREEEARAKLSSMCLRSYHKKVNQLLRMRTRDGRLLPTKKRNLRFCVLIPDILVCAEVPQRMCAKQKNHKNC